MNANTRQTNLPGFDIPNHDYVAVAYHGATNNVNTVTYKLGGASGQTVAVLTFAYVGGVPATNDALLSTVTRTT